MSFLAAAAFALAVVLNVFAATLFASLGLVLLVISFSEWAQSASRFISPIRLAAALVAVALISALVPDPLNASARNWQIFTIPIVVIALVVAELATSMDATASCRGRRNAHGCRTDHRDHPD